MRSRSLVGERGQGLSTSPVAANSSSRPRSPTRVPRACQVLAWGCGLSQVLGGVMGAGLGG